MTDTCNVGSGVRSSVGAPLCQHYKNWVVDERRLVYYKNSPSPKMIVQSLERPGWCDVCAVWCDLESIEVALEFGVEAYESLTSCGLIA